MIDSKSIEEILGYIERKSGPAWMSDEEIKTLAAAYRDKCEELDWKIEQLDRICKSESKWYNKYSRLLEVAGEIDKLALAIERCSLEPDKVFIFAGRIKQQLLQFRAEILNAV